MPGPLHNKPASVKLMEYRNVSKTSNTCGRNDNFLKENACCQDQSRVGVGS